MGLTVGNSFLTANISNERINKILTTNSPPHMTLWEKIKDLFFSTGQKEAFECLTKLCQPPPNLTSDDIEAIFFRLKELASPGCKEQFCHNHICSSSEDAFHIKDKNGSDLLYIGIDGAVCNYTILNQTFKFATRISPDYYKCEYKAHTDGLSITLKEINAPSLGNIKEMWNNTYKISYNDKCLDIPHEKYIKSIISMNNIGQICIFPNNEKAASISKVINDKIDIHAENENIHLTEENKEDIFNHMREKLNINNLALNNTCIPNLLEPHLLTFLNKNECYRKFINECSDDADIKQSIITDITNALSNHTIIDILKKDTPQLVDLDHTIHSYVSKFRQTLPDNESAI